MNRDTRTFHSNTLLRSIFIVCALLMLIISAAGVAAAAMPPVPYFSQCDSRWGSDQLGGDGPTICGMGCALTSTAMVMAYYGADTDPKRLNDAIGRNGSADQSVAFGEPDDLPAIGDWDGDDTIGVYRPGTGEFFMDATVPEVSSSKTIYMDDDFSDNPSEHKWDTIQEGVDDAADGDTVVVHAGEYVENVDVNKSITLEGAGADVVTVTAADTSDDVFYVTADWVHISGFTVTGATSWRGTGIYLGSGMDHCNISDNTVSNNDCGIDLRHSSSNNLTNNTVNSNNDYGIYMGSSSSNNLTNNTVNSNNGYGIGMCYSSSNNLTNNTVNSNNYRGICLYSSNNNLIYHNNLIDNTQNAYDTGTNQWDSGSEGNYYSDYNGTDNGTDGIGEDPHPIPGGGSIDRFPLMQPWAGGTPQKGDLNGDDQITPADAAIVLAFAAGGSASCDAATLAAADVSGDGCVTSLDALMILQAAAGAVEL